MRKENVGPAEYKARVVLVLMFGVAMAYCEAAVVVYLRELFYPEGFSMPLKLIPGRFITVEILRELATIVMLGAVAAVVGKRFWERFGYFLMLFGTWDIFYYIWLKAAIDWPSSLFDWDVLFLIPLPWIGPVIAPLVVAILMLGVGLAITNLYARGYNFRPTASAFILAAFGLLALLYSFMRDTGATLHQQPPQPYLYSLLLVGLILCLTAFVISYRSSLKRLEDFG
jgi:hypothetical protein